MTEVEIVSDVGCGRCDMVKVWLSEHILQYGFTDINVKHTMINDIENKDEYITRAQHTGITTYPLILVDNELITFQQLKEMLG